MSIDLEADSDSILRLHWVELRLRRQVHFYDESGPSYCFNVVVTRMTAFNFSRVRVVVKVQDLAVRDDFSGDAVKVIHG